MSALIEHAHACVLNRIHFGCPNAACALTGLLHKSKVRPIRPQRRRDDVNSDTNYGQDYIEERTPITSPEILFEPPQSRMTASTLYKRRQTDNLGCSSR